MGESVARNPFDAGNAPKPQWRLDFVNWFLRFGDPLYSDIERMFWSQLEWIQPESYVADGREVLTFLTRNEALFEFVLQRLEVDTA